MGGPWVAFFLPAGFLNGDIGNLQDLTLAETIRRELAVSWGNISFALFAIVGLTCLVFGQDDTGWHISPVQINILTDEARPLQLLDDSHHELKGTTWVLDNPELATLVEEGGREVLHPKKAGTVRVIAVRDGESRTREITIWPGPKLPMGTIMWGLKPFGLSQSQLPAAPGGGGPDLFVLSQDSGAIYLQGLSADGIIAASTYGI